MPRLRGRSSSAGASARVTWVTSSHPARRGQRLAAIVAERLLVELGAGTTVFYLGVSEANVPAWRAYERLGFVEVGARPLLYLRSV